MSYVARAITLLQDKGASDIMLKAMGRAISKTVTVVEIIKRRIPGLYQNTETSLVDINYIWEPLEEGLLQLETATHVSMITITLSRRQLDTSSVGYQPVLPSDPLKPLSDFEHETEDSQQISLGRGRGRGWATGRVGYVATVTSQNGDRSTYYNSSEKGWNQGHGRSRGRVRSFSGHDSGFLNTRAGQRGWGRDRRSFGGGNQNDYGISHGDEQLE